MAPEPKPCGSKSKADDNSSKHLFILPSAAQTQLFNESHREPWPAKRTGAGVWGDNTAYSQEIVYNTVRRCEESNLTNTFCFRTSNITLIFCICSWQGSMYSGSLQNHYVFQIFLPPFLRSCNYRWATPYWV